MLSILKDKKQDPVTQTLEADLPPAPSWLNNSEYQVVKNFHIFHAPQAKISMKNGLLN